MGVLRLAFSCFITAETHETGVSIISEGNEAVLGVWSGGNTGRVMVGMMKSTARESSSPSLKGRRRVRERRRW
jgi:hypothetical protein